MSQKLDALSPQEFEHVKGILIALAKTLEQKKAMGSQHGLLGEELTVLNALRHPERGDVEVTVMRSPEGLDIFVSNRREADNPFSVMDAAQARRHVERRPLDSSQNLKAGEYGLFLISFQDRELLKAREDSLIKTYSVHFGFADTPQRLHDPEDDFKTKPLEDCSPDEKWKILKLDAPGDARVEKIKKEFYGIELHFPKYKQNADLLGLCLLPETYKSTIGQLIRDAYPYGVRVSLRSNYPKEHKAQLSLVHRYLQEFLAQIRNRNEERFPEPVKKHWQEVRGFIEGILSKDPELSHFV